MRPGQFCHGWLCAGQREGADFNATRPNELWVLDLTYIATWYGFVSVAFAVEVLARLIVGG